MNLPTALTPLLRRDEPHLPQNSIRAGEASARGMSAAVEGGGAAMVALAQTHDPVVEAGDVRPVDQEGAAVSPPQELGDRPGTAGVETFIAEERGTTVRADHEAGKPSVRQQRRR